LEPDDTKATVETVLLATSEKNTCGQSVMWARENHKTAGGIWERVAAWVAQGGHHPGGAGVGAGASLPVDANAAGDRHLDDVYKPV